MLAVDTLFDRARPVVGMQVRPGVDTYDLAWEYDEPLSVHVVATDEGTVLFGGGDASAADALVDVARDHGVDAVVVEHGDADHYGGVPALRDALGSRFEVAVPAGDAGFLEDAGVDPDRLLEDGDRFYGILAISVPGHTPDNMAYLVDDVLIAGDTVAGADSVFAAEGDWSGPLAPMTPDFNADDAAARENVGSLREFDVEVVLLTHGSNVTGGGREAVETLLSDLGL